MGQQLRRIVLTALATCCPLLAQAQGAPRIEPSSFNSGLTLRGGVFNRDAFVLPDYGPKALRNATDIYNALRPNWQGTFRDGQAGVKSEGSLATLILTDKVQMGQSVLIRGQIAWGLTRADVFGSINGATGQVELFERNPSGEAVEQLNTDGRYIGFLREASRIAFVGDINRSAARGAVKPEILLYWVPDRLTLPTGELRLSAQGVADAEPRQTKQPSMRQPPGQR